MAWWAAILFVQFLTFLAYLCLLINLGFYSTSFKGQNLLGSEVGKSRAWNDTTSATNAKWPSPIRDSDCSPASWAVCPS